MFAAKKDGLSCFRVIFVAVFLVMGVWQSESYAAWSKITIPGTSGINYVAVADSVLFASTDTGVFRSTTNGATWQKVAGLKRCNKLKGNATKLFATSGYDFGGISSLFSSSDKGVSWSKVNTFDSVFNMWIIDLSVQNNNILFIQGQSTVSARPFLSENNGQSWAIVNSSGGNNNVRCCYIMGNNLFLGGNGGVYISSNLGHAWFEANFGLYGIYQGPTKITSSSIFLYVGLQEADIQTGVYCSIDSGATWASMKINHNVTDISFSKTTAFVGIGESSDGTDSGGVRAALLDSSNWTDISMLPKAPVISLATDTGYLYAIAQYYNSVSYNIADTLYRRPLSEVNALLKRPVPGQQQLISNNFAIDHFASRHALGISFNPGRVEKAKLRVYSATGKAIATIFDGTAQNEANKYIWDYKTMPSGIYCISLQSENGKAVKMVQVMK
jgi:hypothetical protein